MSGWAESREIAASSSSRARRPESAPQRRLHLVGKGFHVLAGVRSEADGEALQAQDPGDADAAGSSTLRPEPTIAAATAEAVTAIVGERGLAGLVNNAGIVKPGALEFQPLADFRDSAGGQPVRARQTMKPVLAATHSPGRRPDRQRRVDRRASSASRCTGPTAPRSSALRAISDALSPRAAPVEHPRLADRGRRGRVRDLPEDVRRTRRAGADARRDPLSAVRTADRRNSEGGGEGGGQRGPFVGDREGSRPRAHVRQAEDQVSGRPRREGDRSGSSARGPPQGQGGCSRSSGSPSRSRPGRIVTVRSRKSCLAPRRVVPAAVKTEEQGGGVCEGA